MPPYHPASGAGAQAARNGKAYQLIFISKSAGEAYTCQDPLTRFDSGHPSKKDRTRRRPRPQALLQLPTD